MDSSYESGKMRDLKVSDDVGKMYELGRFDREFAMYGCAFLSEGKNHYLISAHPEKIYDFVQWCHQKGLCPTKVREIQENRPVPSGTREIIAQEIKIALARDIRQAYPKDFLLALEAYGQSIYSDEAAAKLSSLQDNLEGVFEEEKLAIFEGLLNFAYVSRTISTSTYGKLHNNLDMARRDMVDDVVAQDILERVFYGMAYEKQDGNLIYSVNAHREVLYKQKFALEEVGVLVTPIFVKTCWYNYQYPLQDVRRDYEQYLRGIYNRDYFCLLKTLRKRLPESAQISAFQTGLWEAEKKYGQEATDLLGYYGHIWGIV